MSRNWRISQASSHTMPRRTDLIRPLPDEPGPKPKWSEENADMATAPQRNPREVVDFPGCLTVLGDTASPHFSHPERGVRLRPVPRAVLEAPQSGMCTPRTGVQEPEADSGYGNAQRGVLVKIDAAQGTAPQGLSRGKAFQALLEIGAAEGRSINPAQLPANSRGPARTNSPTGNSPPSISKLAAHSPEPGRRSSATACEWWTLAPFPTPCPSAPIGAC